MLNEINISGASGSLAQTHAVRHIFKQNTRGRIFNFGASPQSLFHMGFMALPITATYTLAS